MDILHQHIPSRISQIYVILPRTGYSLDPASRCGLTRLMLRMLEQGAAGLSSQAFSSQLEQLGADISHSLTCDHISLCLSTLTENLEPAVKLFTQALLQPNFAKESLEQIRLEMMSTWIIERQESKRLRATEMFFQCLHQDRPQGNSSHGDPQGMKNISMQDVHRQYQKLFAAKGTFFATISSLPQEKIATLLQPLQALESSQPLPEHPWDNYQPLTPPGRRVTIVPDNNTNTDEILLGRFGAVQTASNWYIHQLADLVLGGDMASRLFHEIRSQRGYSYGASCRHDHLSGNTPKNTRLPFFIYTFPSGEHTANTLSLALNLYENFVKKGITEKELNRTRKYLIHSYPFKKDTPKKQLGWRIGHKLYGIQLPSAAEHHQRLQDLSVADVLKALQSSHDVSAMEIVLLGDPKRLRKAIDCIPPPEHIRTIEYPKQTTIAA